MPCKFNIRLNPAFKGDNGWMDALKAVALEIEQLNQVFIANGLDPIPVNPSSVQAETFLGAGNTIPTENEDLRYAGLVTVAINEYDFIDLSLLPANPTTFFFIAGTPPQAGVFI